MNELEELILKMQQLGESEESIKLVIDNWNEIQESNVKSEDVDEEPGKLTDPALGTDSGSGDGSSESVQDRTLQPNIVIPEIIGDAQI